MKLHIIIISFITILAFNEPVKGKLSNKQFANRADSDYSLKF